MASRPLDILYEDNHLIVVNKPPLIATQGEPAGHESMVTQVKEYLRNRYAKPGNVYLGVVSRLDAWSTGVLVFARTTASPRGPPTTALDFECQGTPEQTEDLGEVLLVGFTLGSE